ncbi:MAG TPA: Crp/Fnr family transcriptional regulator [Actinophytocola sp.]|jgi:CRP-like cAMP-binding protein|nr:Crp/Fnr family transcriptional regulator [Actinophytocola sp.]
MTGNTPLHIVDFLDDAQRHALEALGKPVVYPPQATVYWEGQPSRSVLVIRNGSVKVSQRGPDGMDVILAIRGVNEIIGDEGVLMGEVRSATLTAVTVVEGLDVAANDILRFVDDNRLWPMMYRAAVYRRRQIEEQNLLGRLDVRGRVINWLLDLKDKVGVVSTDGSWVIESTLSQQDIASCIGASRDAVAVELRKLRDRTLITTARRKIVLHDLAGLQGELSS